MDKALKQRLVGAVVLIALAVIVLPMIFGGRPSPSGSEARSIELPAEPPDLEFETRRFPVDSDLPQGNDSADGADRDPAGTANVQTLPQPEDPPAEVDEAPGTQPSGEAAGERMDDLVASLMESESDQSTPDESTPDQSTPDQSTPTPSTPTPGSSRYVVQVASFGNRENATRLAGQLESSGYAVLLDHVSGETGALNRVRVGPYDSESEAQAVATRLREEISGINPRIVDMQPDAAGPALASDDPLMRWVVQVGSFSSQDNAKDLVARLRQAGLSAYEETLTTDSSTIYRVRVGPYLDRDEALAAEQSIGDSLGIDGVVMSSD